MFSYAVVPALASTKSDSKAAVATIQGDVQVVTSGLSSGRYDPIIVQKGIPVKWTIKAEQGDINGCNNGIVIQKYSIQKTLEVGDNVIEFTPTESGTVPFSCWMGMIRSKITVVDDLNNVDSSTIADAGDVPTTSGGGCCAGGGGYGGGYGSGSGSSGSGSGLSKYNNLLGSLKIPADKVAVAEKQSDGTQSVSINFDKNGLSPAIIVVQKTLQTTWNIKASGIDSSKSTLIFPYYTAKLTVNEGDNPISFVPDKDFYFFSTDGSIAGYVKVVDDISKVDTEAIKKEVSQFKPTAGNTL
jgi:plastocyanin domain-containing protein